MGYYQQILAAARKQDPDMLPEGTRYSIDEWVTGRARWSAVSQMAYEGDKDGVAFLTGHGASIHYLAVGVASNLRSTLADIQRLIRKGANKHWAVEAAARAGRFDVVNWLMAQGADRVWLLLGLGQGGHFEAAKLYCDHPNYRVKSLMIRSYFEGLAMGGHTQKLIDCFTPGHSDYRSYYLFGYEYWERLRAVVSGFALNDNSCASRAFLDAIVIPRSFDRRSGYIALCQGVGCGLLLGGRPVDYDAINRSIPHTARAKLLGYGPIPDGIYPSNAKHGVVVGASGHVDQVDVDRLLANEDFIRHMLVTSVLNGHDPERLCGDRWRENSWLRVLREAMLGHVDPAIHDLCHTPVKDELYQKISHCVEGGLIEVLEGFFDQPQARRISMTYLLPLHQLSSPATSVRWIALGPSRGLSERCDAVLDALDPLPRSRQENVPLPIRLFDKEQVMAYASLKDGITIHPNHGSWMERMMGVTYRPTRQLAVAASIDSGALFFLAHRVWLVSILWSPKRDAKDKRFGSLMDFASTDREGDESKVVAYQKPLLASLPIELWDNIFSHLLGSVGIDLESQSVTQRLGQCAHVISIKRSEHCNRIFKLGEAPPIVQTAEKLAL